MGDIDSSHGVLADYLYPTVEILCIILGSIIKICFVHNNYTVANSLQS